MQPLFAVSFTNATLLYICSLCYSRRHSRMQHCYTYAAWFIRGVIHECNIVIHMQPVLFAASFTNATLLYICSLCYSGRHSRMQHCYTYATCVIRGVIYESNMITNGYEQRLIWQHPQELLNYRCVLYKQHNMQLIKPNWNFHTRMTKPNAKKFRLNAQKSSDLKMGSSNKNYHLIIYLIYAD